MSWAHFGKISLVGNTDPERGNGIKVAKRQDNWATDLDGGPRLYKSIALLDAAANRNTPTPNPLPTPY